jgi:hypothetical protein
VNKDCKNKVLGEQKGKGGCTVEWVFGSVEVIVSPRFNKYLCSHDD